MVVGVGLGIGERMSFWRTLKGRWMMWFPYVVFVSREQGWAFSYRRYALVLSEDTTTPYSILHVGPFEFFIRPKCISLDFI